MLLQGQFLVLLVSVPIMVQSGPHGTSRRCPQPPGPGKDQDTIFPKCDFGVGGEPSETVGIPIDSRIGEVNSNLDSDNSSEENISTSNLDEGHNSDNRSEGTNSNTTTTVKDFDPNQTSTVLNVTVPGRQRGCTARPDPGECRGAFPRFFYNEKNDQCDCFLFGGCDEEGIVYTWLTLDECHKACIPGNTIQGPGCERVTLDEVQRFLDGPANNPTSQVDEELDLRPNEIRSRGV